MPDTDNLIKCFFCGGIAGEFNVLFGYPMDTIKVRLQTMPIPEPGKAPLYNGTYDCIKKTIKKEGIKGLFKGIQAPLLVGAPVYAINFLTFGFSKRLIKKEIDQELTKPQLMFSGAFSGVFTSFIMAPTERVKCLLQVQGISTQTKYNGAIDCLRKLYAEGGIRSINRGLAANIIREVPGAAVFFMSYETVRKLILPENANDQQHILTTIFSGGCAGIAYWLVGMPGDVLKTIQQTAPEGKYPNGLRDIYKQLMIKEGPVAFYRGLVPVLVRAFPVNAATFVGFELGDKAINRFAPFI